MDMIEKVARAIDPKAFDLATGHENCVDCLFHQREAARRARAAIEAMRQPTKPMLGKGANKIDFHDLITENRDMRDRMLVAWQAMIDRALEQPQER